MKFKQYLIESTNKKPFSEIINAIWDDCQPFLKDIAKSPGFRGMYSGRGNNNTKDFYTGTVRTDRMARDSDPVVHKMLDKEYKKVFGWNARSNVIFTSGDLHQAQDYGTVYLIFPIGRYKFIWNKFNEDLVDEIPEDSTDRATEKALNNLPEDASDDEIHTQALKYLQDAVEFYVGRSTDKDILQALERKHEIMVNCKEYYAVNEVLYGRLIRSYFNKVGYKNPTKERLNEWWGKYASTIPLKKGIVL